MSYTTGIEIEKEKSKGRAISLEKALNRTYVVKARTTSKGNYAGYISLPKCLVGKRIKIVLVEND